MHPTTIAAIRRFPLLGRPRPDCPVLPLRIKEVTDAADTAMRKREHGMADAAHVLNKAALIASDAGIPELASRFCWQHIDAYCRLTRPLTIHESRYMLEPVLNLARLQIRAEQGAPALRLIQAIYRAVTQRTDLDIGERALPTANLTGDRTERRKLREWVWLQLVGEGTRILAVANRWTDAATHAHTHNGVGAHLMEGRQAVIIAACAEGNLTQGLKVLAESTLTQPWEQQVAACLHLICTEPADPRRAHHLATAMKRLALPATAANYASYRARLGLTIATLASATRPDIATRLLKRTAEEAIDTSDGYGARDILGFRDAVHSITKTQYAELRRIAREAGLGLGELPAAVIRKITANADLAVKVLDIALQSSDQRPELQYKVGKGSGRERYPGNGKGLGQYGE